jgi:hypothetical protein
VMSRLVVHFMKDVLGKNGREQEIRQCTVEVDAASKTEATQLPSRNSAKLRDFLTGRTTLIGCR